MTYSGTAGITGTSSAFTSGVLSGVSVTPTVAGNNLTFIVTGSTKTGTATIATINPGAISQLVMNPTTIASATAGIAATLTSITAKDANGNFCSSGPNAFTGTVTFGGTAGATGTSAAFSTGVLTTFPTLTPTVAGSGKTITATSGSVVGTTTITTVNPGALDHFAFTGVPSTATAGTAMTGITITAQDLNNNTQSSFASTVTYSGTAGVTGTSGSFTAGVLSGVSLTPTKAGSGMTVIATGSAKTGTATITTVNPGAMSSVGDESHDDRLGDGGLVGQRQLYQHHGGGCQRQRLQQRSQCVHGHGDLWRHGGGHGDFGGVQCRRVDAPSRP